MAQLLIAAESIVTASAAPPASPGLSGPGSPASRPTVLSPGYVLIEDGWISEVGQGEPPEPPDDRLDHGVLAPGFVDLQVNGYYGVEFDAVNEAEWRMVAQRLPETGTTAFVPTFITAPLPQLTDALKAAAHLTEQLATAPDTAHILGIHVEGPFINPVRGGAHNHEWMTDPTPQKVTALIDAAQGHLEIITLAPERPGALDAIRQLAQQNILVSVGHSDALARQVAEAADAGARMVTHLFNGQRPLHHREPGVVGQALADPRLTSGLIADFSHVAAPVTAIAFAAAPGRIALVTDAAACAGMPPGEYMLGGQPIELPPGDGVPPVRPDGTLAGSALRMDVAVGNLVSVGVSLPDAIAAATRIPADLIGRSDLGRIAPGARADLTWLSPAELGPAERDPAERGPADRAQGLRAEATWLAGHRVH